LATADNLKKMGYKNVKSLAGGWREWKKKELPVES
jgi:rhodanese-related sulfurtransferase